MALTATALAVVLSAAVPAVSQVVCEGETTRPSERRDPEAETDGSGGRDALVTDRPDATESPETLAPGRFQLETGYTFTSVQTVHSHTLGEALLRVGVSDAVELRLGLNSYRFIRTAAGTARGLENSGIGLKFRVLSGGAVGELRPAVAILASASIPTGAAEVDASSLDPEVRVAAGWNPSVDVSVSTNLSWTSSRDDVLDRRVVEWGVSLSVGYSLGDRWGGYLEYFGTYRSSRRDTEQFLNTGLTYLVSNDLQLDARVGYGLNDRANDFFLGLGTAVRW